MIRTAVVGVGYLGQYHAEKLKKLKTAELVAIVDTDLKRAQKLAKRFGAIALSSYKELGEHSIDCVCVVTPTNTHFEIASWLLEQGIDVLVEKPITVEHSEARVLVELAKKHSCILQVGHLERFNPAFRVMKDALTKPMFFEVRRIAKFTGRGHDVDVVLDLMIHDIDIVAHLVGRPVERIEAIGIPVLTSSIDIANARVTFEGGAIANFTASRAAFVSERTIRVFQPEVYLSLDFEKKRLKAYTKSDSVEESGFPRIDVREMKIEMRDALEHEIEAFLESVKSRVQPEVTGEDGLRALELAHEIRRSVKAHALT